MAVKFSKSLQAKKRAFLTAYVELGHIGQSATAAGVDRTTHYYWMREDPDYVGAFHLAEEMAASALEDEARRRALQGVKRLKFHKGDPIIDPDTGEPYFEHEYSDTLLIFLLKSVYPEKFRERRDVNHSGSIDTGSDKSVNEQIAAEIEKAVQIRLREQATLIPAAATAAADDGGHAEGNGHAGSNGKHHRNGRQ